MPGRSDSILSGDVPAPAHRPRLASTPARLARPIRDRPIRPPPGAIRLMKTIRASGAIGILMALAVVAPRCHARDGDEGEIVRGFLDRHCTECHDSATKKGGLDLAEMEFDLATPGSFARWVAVHDRVSR